MAGSVGIGLDLFVQNGWSQTACGNLSASFDANLETETAKNAHSTIVTVGCHDLHFVDVISSDHRNVRKQQKRRKKKS